MSGGFCLVAIATMRERALARPTACLGTGCHESGEAALLVVVRSERLAKTAGDARTRERPSAESGKGIPYLHGR
jgi:hypothetical protein